ncbi:outer membrane beta-barrel domain-containing protein [Trichloromonas acetexigens]|uniref:Outer membrane beta-barrel domain-containing protein n=1 Tax=Trichloromonas acetexigens TaxID=38815 RepID=A0A550JDD1_9BACT|nr:outer membrane beta-barrel domain-containing protein [Desulfuromonas acetexigens]TRO81209.1 outer membrane beta-barrel domain-containing protein [Desulfuromonas acetexigens]
MKHMLYKLLVGLLAVGLTAGAASAENRAGALTISPMYGGYLFEGDQNFEDDNTPTFGLGLGYNLTKSFSLEAAVNYIDDFEGRNNQGQATEVEGLLYRLEGLYHFMPENALVPYIAVGAGNIALNPEVGRLDDTFGANYGVGVKYYVSEHVAFRVDARHFIAFDQGLDEGNHTNNNLLYTAGMHFQIGGESAAPAPRDSDGDGVTDDLDKCPDTPKGVVVDADGCPVDSDGDGVPDYLDKCPDTPKGVAVDANGCPAVGDADGDGVADDLDKCPDTPKGVVVDADGCPVDSDGDGVPDYLDKCPDTPRGAAVDANGCPLDSDGDGVYDYLDKCPGTPRGVVVDEKGCPVSFTMQIEFDFDKADIRPMYHNQLKEAADFINKYPANQILVAGHTDSKGSDAYNKKLSQRRADNVRKYLVNKFGISANKLVARGYGESQPIASNDTDAGRQQNRRVEVICCTVIPAE